MEDVLRLAIVGASSGALVALAGLGLVLVYRGSGVINFAHGALGSIGAFAFWELSVERGWPTLAAGAAGVAASAASGLLVHLLVLRPMRQASGLTRLIATLAVLVVLQAGLSLRYGASRHLVAPFLPTDTWRLGDIPIGKDRVILVLLAVSLSGILWYAYRHTHFGRATSAVAENPTAASALGLSPDVVAALNWAAGAALAGLAAILLSPLVGVTLTRQTQLIAPALAAALIGGMRSFPLTIVGGIAIGIAEAQVAGHVRTPGWSSAVPFLVVVVVLVVRGRSVPVRALAQERRPAVGAGRVRPLPVLLASGLALVAIWSVLEREVVDAVSLSLGLALVLLSAVVVIGYAGQLSLCQFSLAGVGAIVAGRLVGEHGWPFGLAAVAAVVVAVPIGLLVGLPALRLRGVNLAVATMTLAVALDGVLFGNPDLSGAPIPVPPPELLGIELGSLAHPEAYATLCLVVFAVAAVLAANLRRSGSGRRMLAVRANERSAAAVGIDVTATKLAAFTVGSCLAALGGVLLAFRQPVVVADGAYPMFESVTVVVSAVLGGIGFLVGPLVGVLGEPAGVVDTWLRGTSDRAGLWLQLAGGLVIVRVLQVAPDGAVAHAAHTVRALVARVQPTRPAASPPAAAEGASTPSRRPGTAATRMVPRRLEVEGITVRFGAVCAVDDVSLSVEPGEVVGLIGANGAGKTSFVEAVTGYVRPVSGSVRLGGQAIGGWSVHRRARGGLSRSFQSLELFDDLTVEENLRAAVERPTWSSILVDLVRPRRPPLPAHVLAAVDEFDLGADLGRLPSDLPYGRRSLVGIARAVATSPSVLCLDEPAAGLSEVESDELGRLLRRLCEEWGMGILLIEHDVRLVMSVCDRVVALDFGRVISSGTAAEVRADPALRRAYLGAEAVP